MLSFKSEKLYRIFQEVFEQRVMERYVERPLKYVETFTLSSLNHLRLRGKIGLHTYVKTHKSKTSVIPLSQRYVTQENIVVGFFLLY